MKDEKILQDILETVEFIRDHAASKDDIVAVRQDMATEFTSVRQDMATEFTSVRQDMATEFTSVRQEMATKEELREVKKELRETKDELINHIDGFIALHEKLETEIAALNGKCQRLETFIHQIAKHVGLQLSS